MSTKLDFRIDPKFPRDEGMHEAATDEWWYFNCHLKSNEGTSYSAAVCFFPTYLLLMFADITNKRMIHNKILVNQNFSASSNHLNVAFGKNRWVQDLQDLSRYEMHCENQGFILNLQMSNQKTPMLVDGRGQIKEGLLGRSYYYAQTRLMVQGEVEFSGNKIRVSGFGWIDRQWGEWVWSGIGSWIWFSIQLSNEVEMLIIQITNPLTNGISSRTFTVCGKGGEVKVLRDFHVVPTSRWQSPASKRSYESRWTISSESPLVCHLRVLPDFDSQEVMYGLWEGACNVSGEFGGERVTGRAFVEQSHGRIYGSRKKKFILLCVGLIQQCLRRMHFPKTDLVDKADKILHIMG